MKICCEDQLLHFKIPHFNSLKELFKHTTWYSWFKIPLPSKWRQKFLSSCRIDFICSLAFSPFLIVAHQTQDCDEVGTWNPFLVRLLQTFAALLVKRKFFVTNSAACDVQYRDPDFFPSVNSFSFDTYCSAVCVVPISEFIDDDLSSSLGITLFDFRSLLDGWTANFEADLLLT